VFGAPRRKRGIALWGGKLKEAKKEGMPAPTHHEEKKKKGGVQKTPGKGSELCGLGIRDPEKKIQKDAQAPKGLNCWRKGKLKG